MDNPYSLFFKKIGKQTNQINQIVFTQSGWVLWGGRERNPPLYLVVEFRIVICLDNLNIVVVSAVSRDRPALGACEPAGSRIRQADFISLVRTVARDIVQTNEPVSQGRIR